MLSISSSWFSSRSDWSLLSTYSLSWSIKLFLDYRERILFNLGINTCRKLDSDTDLSLFSSEIYLFYFLFIFCYCMLQSVLTLASNISSWFTFLLLSFNLLKWDGVINETSSLSFLSSASTYFRFDERVTTFLEPSIVASLVRWLNLL